MAVDAERTSIETYSGTLPEVWDSVVQTHPEATAFHTGAWKRAIERTFDYEPEYVVISDESQGDPLGVVPLFRVGELLGESLTNPFCEYGYPLLDAAAAPGRVISALASCSGRFDAVICKERRRPSVRGYYPHFGAVETGVTFRVPTDVPFDLLWKNAFNRDLRSNVATARDHGLAVSETTDTSAYYDLYRRTMRRLGSPTFPREFFDQLQTAFGADCHLLLVDEDAPKAGLLVLDFGGERYVLSNASDPAHWDERANELLYCTVIEDACDGEYSVVDFGRTEPGSSLHEFKRKFGGAEVPLASFVHRPRHVSRASISSYKRLQPVTRRLGAALTHPRIGPALKEWIHE